MEPSRAVGTHRPPGCLGVNSVSSRPISSQIPRATSTMPITMVTYGRYCCTMAPADMVSAANTPNTVKNPRPIPAVAARARPTAAEPVDVSAPSRRTTRTRYAGSMAKPHGFSAATNPAVNAKLSRPWSTNVRLRRQRGNTAGELLLGHRRGGVVHERRSAVAAIEHVGRLPRDVVASPDRPVGVVEIGEVQVVLRHEVLHRAHVRAGRDTDKGDPWMRGGYLADTRSFGVAERAPGRPEPQHGR